MSEQQRRPEHRKPARCSFAKRASHIGSYAVTPRGPGLKGSLGLWYPALILRVHQIPSDETQRLKPLAANPQQLRPF